MLEFVPGQKNLVLYGPVGVGKTHLAIAACVKACNLGYKTKFYTVTELVLKLAEARKNGTLERLLRDLRSLDLLILDELYRGGVSFQKHPQGRSNLTLLTNGGIIIKKDYSYFHQQNSLYITMISCYFLVHPLQIHV